MIGILIKFMNVGDGLFDVMKIDLIFLYYGDCVWVFVDGVVNCV